MSAGNPLARAWRKLARDGPAGAWQALKWRIYRRKRLIVVARESGALLPAPPRLLVPQDVVVRLATPADADAMAANFPERREQYHQRLTTPGYWCTIAVQQGRVLAHNWFCTVPHLDREMACWIRPGPGEAYFFEGWTTPARRGIGIAHLGLVLALAEVMPAEGIRRSFTFIEEGNLTTRKFHRRYGFHEVGRKSHLRLGPFRFNSRIKPLAGSRRDPA